MFWQLILQPHSSIASVMSLKISLNERGSNIKTLMLLMKGEGWVERMRKGEGGMGGGEFSATSLL